MAENSPQAAADKIDDRALAIGRIYGRALLDAAGDQVDALGEEVESLVALLDRSPELEATIASPSLDAASRRDLIEKVFRGRASDLLTDALQVINRKERLRDLRSVLAGFRRELRERRGILQVEARSAVPLSSALRERLVQAVTKSTGRKIELIEKIDAALLGGLVLQAGDQRIDSSVATALKTIGGRLFERGAREIQSGKVGYATEG